MRGERSFDIVRDNCLTIELCLANRLMNRNLGNPRYDNELGWIAFHALPAAYVDRAYL
jgi:hypothetical protein